MAWHYDESVKRIMAHLAHLDRIGPIEISRLGREMDLSNLTETRCRMIYGAHVYIAVSNFPKLVSDKGCSDDDYRRLIRSVHLYQRAVSRLIESELDGVRIHFQGAKVHALFYRPIDNAEELASRAVLLGLMVKAMVRDAFNPLFPSYGDFTIATGIDLGDAIGTRNGSHADKELLFLGSPANHAAKIIDGAGSISLTSAVYEALPDDLRAICWEDSRGYYRASASDSRLRPLLDAHNVAWSADDSKQWLDDDHKALPLRDIGVSGAREKIDLDRLSVHNNKAVQAATIYADVSGFTGYIDGLTSDDDRVAALRLFHAIRRELAIILKRDFDGLRIQYQGDRVQALFHLPADDDVAIANTVVRAAAGVQASMQLSLPECLPEAKKLQLAIGVDLGKTLVSRLGTRGERDVMCIGESVEQAAHCEEVSDGGDTAITPAVHEQLADDLKLQFVANTDKTLYVATDLTTEKLAQAERGRAYDRGAPTFIRSLGAQIAISAMRQEQARETQVRRPWHP